VKHPDYGSAPTPVLEMITNDSKSAPPRLA
jgi:hypothetical protein